MGCRSGAGAVAELAAAGKPSLLVPFPFAADNHQLRNAESFLRAGAATLVLDREMTGRRLFDEIESLRAQPERLARMGSRARELAHPGAASRAADVLEGLIRVCIGCFHLLVGSKPKKYRGKEFFKQQPLYFSG